METERRIVRNASVIVAAKLAAQVANFLFVVLLARNYHPEQFGEYSFALSLGALCAVFVNFGTTTLLLRKCSEDITAWRESAGLIIPFQLILSITIIVLLVAVLMLISMNTTSLAIVAIVVTFQLVMSLWMVFSIAFVAADRTAFSAVTDLSIRILILVFGGAIIAAGIGIEYVLLVLPASAVVAMIVLASLAVRKFGAPEYRLISNAIIEIWKDSLPYFVMIVLTVASLRIGIMMLRYFSGAVEVGIFAPAERLVMAGGILNAAFGLAIFPTIVRLFKSDLERYLILVNRSARAILLLTLPLGTVIFLFAEDIILLLFGPVYSPTAPVLRVIAWLLVLRGIGGMLQTLGIASDRKADVVIARSIALVILVVMCVVMIPKGGAVGLAVAMLLAHVAMIVILAARLRPLGFAPAIIVPAIPVVAACSLTCLVALQFEPSQTLARVLTVGILGPVLLFIFRAVRREDLAYIRALLGSRSGPENQV